MRWLAVRHRGSGIFLHASTGRPTTDASTPSGGFSAALMSSTTCFWRSSGISLMPKARLAVLRSAVTTPWEK